MGNLFTILDVGLSGLFAHQAATQVAANNIANATTEGYSRQRLELETRFGQITPQGIFGRGVQIDNVRRIRDFLLDVAFRNQTQTLGRAEAEALFFSRVEDLILEPSSLSLNQGMADFFNAFQVLANNPESSAARQAVVSAAQAMSDTFNFIATELDNLRTEANGQIIAVVDDVNSITAQIADLNQQILSQEAAGAVANNLRDRRDLLLDELSQIIGIRMIETANGNINVSSAGISLVQGSSAISLTTVANPALDPVRNDLVEIQVGSSGIVLTPAGGTLAGLLNARDIHIPGVLTDLNTLAAGIITEVNNLHSTGFGLNGSTGNNFFAGTNAFDIAVDSVVSGNLNNIAASQSADPLATGNNLNALALAQLREALVMSGGTATFNNFFEGAIADLGTQAEFTQRNLRNSEVIVQGINRRRLEVSSVSIDEEAANLLRFQRAFEASARVIRTVDELLQTIIFDMGV